MNGPFAPSRLGLLLLFVITDDRVDDEAPVPLELCAKPTEEFEDVRVKSHAGGNLGWGHEGLIS